MSTSLNHQFTAEQIQSMRELFTHFRILVIGRANAGKTTILQRICNATGEPIIFNPDGDMIESSTVEPNLERGIHDIENQMIFQANPGFIFHDSRGFEAGDDVELMIVQRFIKERSRATDVNERLHAIWYCIPSSDNRPITAAEKIFFSERETAGVVPVIVLWTKTDCLNEEEASQLMNTGINTAEAMQQAPQRAEVKYQDIKETLSSFPCPPMEYVALQSMQKSEAQCTGLIEQTTKALSQESQRLFLSTQQNNIELCIEYGIERVMKSPLSKRVNWVDYIAAVLGYFPHFHIYTFNIVNAPYLYIEIKRKEYQRLHDHPVQFKFLNDREDHDMKSISKIMTFIVSNLSAKFNLKEATYCAIVAAIIGHLSFNLNQQPSKEKNSLERAAQIYQDSTRVESVKEAVEGLFNGSSNLEGSSKHEFQVKGAKKIASENLFKFIYNSDDGSRSLV